MRFRPPPRLPRLLLALLSLGTWAAAAEAPPEKALRFRRVSLTSKTEVVRVAPGMPTTLTFDEDLHTEQVAVDDPARVRLVSVAARSITVLPRVALGGGVALRAPFRGEPPRAEPGFLLITEASEVDAQVMVFRDASAPELAQARVAELEARCAACEAELAAQRERDKASGPAGLVLSGRIGEKGVTAARLSVKASTDGVLGEDVRRYLSDTWVVLAVELDNPSGAPWRPGKAWLESEATGGRVEARTVAMAPDVLPPGERARVVVEFERPPGRMGDVFRLRVQAADGRQPLSVPGVVIQDAAPEKHSP